MQFVEFASDGGVKDRVLPLDDRTGIMGYTNLKVGNTCMFLTKREELLV